MRKGFSRFFLTEKVRVELRVRGDEIVRKIVEEKEKTQNFHIEFIEQA